MFAPQSKVKEIEKKGLLMRVLIVEDNFDLAHLISILVSNFADFDIAYDVKQALDLVQRTTYNYVITDYSMPGLSGEDLAKHMKDSGVPVVLNSAVPELVKDRSLFHSIFSKMEMRQGISALFQQPSSSKNVCQL